MSTTNVPSVRMTALEVPASRIGLSLPDRLDFEEWSELGQRLATLHGSSAWWIGDWVNYGFWEYGERYVEGMEATGLAYQTLANYRSVAGRFDFSRRRENLSFGHHEAVAALEPAEQDRWLDTAAEKMLSVMALREELQGAREIPAAETTVTLEQIRFTVPPDRAERWKSAAEKSGQAFSEWAASVLDQAAA